MHDGMQYDPIQGQDQGHEHSKVGHFKSYFPPTMMGLANDHGFLN